MATPVRTTVKQVKPILSLNPVEARRRVINLYKAWYRQIPFIQYNYDLPKTSEDCKQKLKEEFRRYAHVQDIRVIDTLLIKGQMELQEVTTKWKPPCTLLNYWRDTVEEKPKDFMSKFLKGQD